MTQLVLARDATGANTFSPSVSSQKKNFTLTTAGGELTFEAPTECTKGYVAVFSFEPGAKVWFALGASAVDMPVANTVNDCNSELNPTSRSIAAGATMRFKTNDTSVECGVAFYELSQSWPHTRPIRIQSIRG